MTRRAVLWTGAAYLASGGGAAAGAPALRVPAEEAPHARTFMQWPVSRRVYGDGGFLTEVQACIARIANTIAEFEPVVMLAAAADHRGARRRLSGTVALWDVPTEDLWCRDAGPLFARDGAGHPVISHIQFNGWGRKQVHARDGAIAGRVARRLGLRLMPSGLTGEAGGAKYDGHGTLIAHESSWVIGNRNPGLSRDQIGARLKAAYGADRVIWAPGLKGQDITDYHIDSLARLTGPGRCLINLPRRPDRRDPFHRAARHTRDILSAAGLRVETIPEPDKRRITAEDFVASYANYYLCNGAVIMAEFGDPETDRTAARALGRHYPGRVVRQLNVDELGLLGGGIHCATQQMPA